MPKLRAEFTDEKIVNATGKTIRQWFSELHKKDLQTQGRKRIQKFLIHEHEIDKPWAKLIAKRFIDEFGLKDVDSKNFGVSVQKTYAQPAEMLFDRTRSWMEQDNRVVSASSQNDREIECLWGTDDSSVAIRFRNSGEGKTKVIVLHDRLASEIDADIMRNFWKQNLSTMAEAL